MEKFGDVIEKMMADRGMPAIEDKVFFAIPDADKRLYQATQWYFNRIGKEFKPIPEYREVANWLAGNNGLGLLLYGNHGRGKTILAKHLIPAVLLYFAKLGCNYFTSTQLRQNINKIMQNKIIIIDDFGVESESVEYGNRRNLFDEIMDAVEQQGKLIILTTNLTGEEIKKTYGAGVYDRILACTKRIRFVGESFRR